MENNKQEIETTEEKAARILLKLKDEGFGNLKNKEQFLKKLSEIEAKDEIEKISKQFETVYFFVYLYDYKDWGKFIGSMETFYFSLIEQGYSTDQLYEICKIVDKNDKPLLDALNILSPKSIRELMSKYEGKEKNS